MALWNGDPTARDRGRLTLNPLAHVDPFGSVVLPVALLLFRSPIVLGWARPVPISWANLRHPVNDAVKVALAGPASNLLLAFVFAGLARLAPEHGFLAPLRFVGYAGVVLNCALALFNLIPIPPLDGSWVLMRFLPMRHILALQHFRIAGLALLVVLMAVPGISQVLLFTPLRIVVHGYLDLFGLPRAGAGL
jgi:Zn-dependent protease